MAIITIPTIKIGDEIKVETFNEFITSVNAVSTSGLNAENIRDEGIDRRNLATNSVQEMFDTGIYSYSSADDHEVIGAYPSWNKVSDISTGKKIEVGRPTAIECKDNEWIMVNCSFSFRAAASVLIPASFNSGGQEVHFKLRWQDLTAGTINDIAGTERRFNTFMVMDTSIGQKYHSNLRYSCTIVGAIQPLSTTSGTHEIAIDLQARDQRSKDPLQAGQCVVEQVTMFARVIKR